MTKATNDITPRQAPAECDPRLTQEPPAGRLDGVDLTDARDRLENLTSGILALRWALDALWTQAELMNDILYPIVPDAEAQS